MGKRRIEIEKIENRKKMNVTFTKRRQGLFKKADQLSRLCNAQIAILVFSNSGNPYVYGNLDKLTQQYFSNSPSSSSAIAIDHIVNNNNNKDNNQVVNSETLMMMGLSNYVDNQLDTEEETAGLEDHQQLCFSIDDFDFEIGTDGSANYDHCNNMIAAASSICNDLLNPYPYLCVNVKESSQDETCSHDQHSYLSPWDVDDEEFAMLLSPELQYDQCLFPTD